MIDFLIRGLAVYRFSRLIALEDGPAWIFKRLRSLIRERAGADSWISEGIQCPYCVSFWLSLLSSPSQKGLAIAGLVAWLFNLEEYLGK